MRKKVSLIVLIVLTAAWAVVRLSGRRGRLREVGLAADKIEKVDFLRLRSDDGFWLEMRREKPGWWSALSSQGAFTPDASRVEDFLHLLNLWEVAEITSSDEVGADGGEPMRTLRLTVRHRGKRLLNFKALVRGEDFYVCVNRREAYKMTSPWQRSSWRDFFGPSTAVWQNRLLIDLNYFEIESVRVGDSVYSPAGVPDSEAVRFSAFKQVYFDFPSESPIRPVTGECVREITVTATDGRVYGFQIFTKVDALGNPDPFKAIVLKGPYLSDTVEVPWVVLDKMTGVGGGF